MTEAIIAELEAAARIVMVNIYILCKRKVMFEKKKKLVSIENSNRPI